MITEKKIVLKKSNNNESHKVLNLATNCCTDSETAEKFLQKFTFASLRHALFK